MRLPLTENWRLRRGTPHAARDETPRWTLPGASDLTAFAPLLDIAPEEDAAQESAPGEDAPFSLPGALPEGEGLTLWREIDFGALSGDRAQVVFEHVEGSGEAFFDGEPPIRFETGALALDATDALRRGRARTLCLRFDAGRPAGVYGAALLRATRFARFARASLAPDASEGSVRVCAQIEADSAGDYALRVAVFGADAPSEAREISFSLAAGEAREASLSVELRCARFAPGEPYAVPALRLTLLRGGALCDERTLLCGLPGEAPRAFWPLTDGEAAGDPDLLAARLREARVPCVALGENAPEPLLRALTRAGVAALLPEPARARLSRFPCAHFAPEDALAAEALRDPLALSAWRLCGMTAFDRAADASLDARAMLFEAAGLPLDPDLPQVREALSALRALRLRLIAEAARQRRRKGALCLPGEALGEAALGAVAAAFAPLHLSALPLLGAWWTQARFSASVAAFVPEGAEGYEADVALEDELGVALARLRRPCPESGDLGFFEAELPDRPCALTLRARLWRGGAVREESALPVYVGERGPLEAAFVGLSH